MVKLLTTFIFAIILRKFDVTCATQNETQYGTLANISISDILSYRVNGNAEITKKIVTTISEFASNYNAYKTIKLSVLDYSLPSKFMEMNIGGKRVFFYNLTATQWFSNGDYNHNYSTLVGCDWLGNAKIHVSLPTMIKIQANLVLSSVSCEGDCATSEGLITFTLQNAALLRTSLVQSAWECSETNISYKITYNDSSMHAELDIQNHQSFYDKSKTLVNKIESSVGNYLLKQLNDEIIKRNISLSSTCSKFMKISQADERYFPLPCYINNKAINVRKLFIIEKAEYKKLPQVLLNVMQGSDFETDEFVTLNTGPVVIEGLSKFSNIEIMTSFLDTLNSSDLYDKRQIIKIKIDSLKGKFSWYYNLKDDDTKYMLEFPFFINYLTIERTIIRTPSTCNYRPCIEEFLVRSPQVDITFGKIQIAKTLKNNIYCERQGKFEQVDLTEYLESVIATTLKNSIVNEINMNKTANVDFFNN